MARAAVTAMRASAPPLAGRSLRGAAVVLAMLLAALAATISVTLFAEQQRWTRAVEHRRDQVQAQALVFAAIQWARQILNEDARLTLIDHLGEPWAVSLPPIPLENGEIRGSITDAQARLNVNALAGTEAATAIDRDRIARLFAQHGGPADAINAIADWVDVDATPRMNGAEDDAYASRPIPGVAANAPVVRVAELAHVPGMTLGALAGVAPFLAALPPGTPLNVNTASREVLAAVFAATGNDTVAAIVAARARRPFNTIADFRARLPEGVVNPGETTLTVRSDYFLVSVEARQGTTIARARALVHRGGGGGRAWPEVVWQVIE
jgi:general secretion pathway protein K